MNIQLILSFFSDETLYRVRLDKFYLADPK